MTVIIVILKVILLPLLLLLTSCSPEKVNYTYIGDGSSGGWTRSPEGWSSSKLNTPDPSRSIQGFWAPGGSIEKVLIPSDILSGILQSHKVPPASGDQLENAAVGVVFPDYNTALQGVAKELQRSVTFKDGFKYTRLSFQAAINGGEVIVEQLSVIDEAKNRVQSIALGCSPICFNRESSTIKDIINSWKADI